MDLGKVNLEAKIGFMYRILQLKRSRGILRAKLEVSRQFTIYQQTTVSLKIDEFNIQINGEVNRIGHDRPIPKKYDSVLIMIKFNGSDQQNDALQDLIDELNQRW